MAKKTVTNAMRMLKSSKIDFDTVEYNGDELLTGDDFGVKVAELTGIDKERSFKTLVARGDKSGVIVAVIPVDEECDLKKLAKASNNKKAELIHVRELLALTGYIRGGVSPIGMKKKYPTYIHKSCIDFDKIAVSGGACGITLILAPNDVIKITDAAASDIIKGD